jgi:hypothetical protein
MQGLSLTAFFSVEEIETFFGHSSFQEMIIQNLFFLTLAFYDPGQRKPRTSSNFLKRLKAFCRLSSNLSISVDSFTLLTPQHSQDRGE